MAEFVLFGAGTPGALDEADGPIALATQWRINAAGNYWVTGVEFYQAANAQPGGSSYEVAIWERIDDATPGTKHRTKTVLCSSVAAGGGRRRIMFDTPLLVTSATSAGFYAVLGSPQRYTATAGYFTSAGETSGPITAAQDGTTHGRNGRFKVGVSTADYPTSHFNGGGYWVTPIVTDEDPGGTPVTVTDTPGTSAGGGSPEAVTSETVALDTPGGLAGGGVPDVATADAIVVDAPGPAAAGGAPDTVIEGADVAIVDRPYGSAAGGSGAAVITEATLSDSAVWPLLEQALTCLQAQVANIESPPRYVQIRPGVDFSAGISQVEDECCEGSAWVRVMSISPTDDFPTPLSGAVNCVPSSLAVEIELGILRCRPVGSDVVPGNIVTGDQWSDTARLVMNDAAALRRTACCIAALVGSYTLGQWTPTAVDANCVGGTMRMTIEASACDFTC